MAFATALMIGALASAQPAWAQDTQPPATDSATSTQIRKVSGVACVDADRNGFCSSDEARIPNVIIRTDTGAVTATDNSGAYTIDVPANAALDVTIPEGYKSLDGNPRIQLMAADRLDIALVLENALPIPTIVAPSQLPIKVELPSDFVQPNVRIDMDLRPVYYTLAAIGGVLLLSQLVISVVLRGIRKTYQKSLDSQNAALMEQRTRDVSYRMQDETGWQIVAEQLMADALAEPVSIDGEAGILDATVEPAPKFTLASRDGREFTFTIAPNLLKKQRLLQRGDKVFDISGLSPRSHADASMLWEYVMFSRRLWRVTPPSNAKWYVAVRGTRRQSRIGIETKRGKQLASPR
jgi:hypothetical protein